MAENNEYKNLTNGEYEGRLVYVGDLGMQERSYMGDVKPPARQLSLGIEILGESVTIDGQALPRILWTKPFNVFYQMNEKGNEYKYFKTFNSSAKDGTVADWQSVLGQPCNVNIIQVQGKNANADKVYDNIDTIGAIPAKYQDAVAPATVTDMAIGEAGDENNVATKALYGLAKYVFDKRLDGGSGGGGQATAAKADVAVVDVEEAAPF